MTRADADVPRWRREFFRYFPWAQSRIRASMMDLREDFHEVFADNENSKWAEEFKQDCLTKIRTTFPSDSPEDKRMREVLTPGYAIGCKRVLVSDDWYPALARSNVTLETRGIQRIDGNGPVVADENGEASFADGEGLDVLISATGFATRHFLSPLNITGRNGRKLDDIWVNGPKALNGVAVPDLPNFGMLYGPNTNLGHSSIVLMLEAQSRYINGLIGAVLDGRKPARQSGVGLAQSFDSTQLLTIVPKTEAVDNYEEEMQDRLGNSPWADPRCNSWYKDAKTGKITNNWPGDCREYGKRLSKVDWSQFEGGENVSGIRKGQKAADVGRVREETYVSDKMLLGMGIISAAAASVGAFARYGPKLSALF